MTQPLRMTPRRAKINGLQPTVTMVGNMSRNGGLSFEMGAEILWVPFRALYSLFRGTGMGTSFRSVFCHFLIDLWTFETCLRSSLTHRLPENENADTANRPTQWDCADIGETHCSDVVTCKEANVPVAGMTLTSFANIHMVRYLNCLVHRSSNTFSSTTISIPLFMTPEALWAISSVNFRAHLRRKVRQL